MSEINQLKKRINESGPEGIETAIIRDDYQPAGDLMIMQLVDSNKFVTRRVNSRGFMGLGSEWRIFKAEFDPC